MSVETQCHQSHSTSESFKLSSHQDESIEQSALNLSQIHRKSGRKRSTPQKTINPEEEYVENGSSEDETFASQHSPELKINENSNEETSEKTKSILEHYRSFIQRNTGRHNRLLSIIFFLIFFSKANPKTSFRSRFACTIFLISDIQDSLGAK